VPARPQQPGEQSRSFPLRQTGRLMRPVGDLTTISVGSAASVVVQTV